MTHPNTELFDRLYRSHREKVYKLALGLSGNPDDAEEITQEAFSRAFRAYDAFREECSFFTWIYRITINVANGYLKHRAKFPVYALVEDLGYSLDEVIDPDPGSDPETELLARQAKVRCLHSLTECLRGNERLVFCLAITLGLPHKHVADILECSSGSVKTTLHRARKRWFGYMDERCQLIKKTNPCSCRQWVRFGLSQGWITKDALSDPRPPTAVEAGKEVIELRTLRDFYRDLYQGEADERFAQRMREGMQNKEWAIFS